MYNNIIKLAKGPYSSKGCLLLCRIPYFSSSFLFLVRLKLLHFNQTLKKEGLYSEIDNIASIADPLIYRILFNSLLLLEIDTYYTAKRII